MTARRWSLLILAIVLAAWLAAAFTAGRMAQAAMDHRGAVAASRNPAPAGRAIP